MRYRRCSPDRRRCQRHGTGVATLHQRPEGYLHMTHAYTERAARRAETLRHSARRSNMQPTTEMKGTIAEVLAERKLQLSPGRIFADVCVTNGLAARVEYDVTITDLLTSSRRKPRYPARNMLKVVDLSKAPQRYYWHESPPRPGDPEVNQAEL